jgi:3-hydroxybutyrate dehydrogenase
VRTMLRAALERLGRLDGLVLNATHQHRDAFPDFPEEQWDRVLDVNLRGPWLAMREAWPHLTDAPGKRIVVTASTSSFQAEPRKVAYIVAKTALLGLVRAAAVEAAPYELTVNGVAPGLMDTPLVRWQLDDKARELGVPREQVEADWLSGHAIERYVATEEVARTIAFLAGPDSSGITGQVIPVDLGQLAKD